VLYLVFYNIKLVTYMHLAWNLIYISASQTFSTHGALFDLRFFMAPFPISHSMIYHKENLFLDQIVFHEGPCAYIAAYSLGTADIYN
jgi:hypothetical protein